MNSRDYYREQAKIIIDASEKGEYNYKGNVVKLNKIIKPDFISNNALLEVEYKPKDIKTQKFETFNDSVVDCIIYASKMNPGKTIGVLNFASAKHPGGGFVNGAMAQEEALCQASTLYTQIKDHPMYQAHQEKFTSGIYNNDMLITRTQFMRDGNALWLEKPVTATVITAAAVNCKNCINEGNNIIQRAMNNRILKITKAFAEYSCDIIILGAFGCGVFGNDPYNVATSFKSALERLGGYFDKVYFAISGKTTGDNYIAFAETFFGR